MRHLSVERIAHVRKDFLVFGKAEPVFPGNDFIADTNGKLPTVARNERYFSEAEFTLEQVRHTGGARQIISNDAIAYDNTFHLSHPQSKKITAPAHRA
jgi:hypothetical protein